MPHPDALTALAADVAACRRCPRLVTWRERVARDKRAAFADQEYWGRPVPGFGDPGARILFVGLAPAAHGGNRTGRIFTGDRSGDFLFAALHRAGLANQPLSTDRRDGLRLTDAYVAAAVRCAPPGNEPTPEERDACLPTWPGRSAAGPAPGPGRPRGVRLGRGPPGPGHAGPSHGPAAEFGHGAEVPIGPYALLGSYHVSQQNTFTGRLTPEMLDAVLTRAIELARPPHPG